MFGSDLGPEYRKLWTASAISNLGDGITFAAAPLLAAALTRDPTLVAGLTFVNRLPWILFPLIAGAVVDRLDRRRVMVAMNGFRSVIVGALGLGLLAGWASLPLLYGVFFLLGTAQTFFDIASQALRPAVVPREALDKANGRIYAVKLVGNYFAGPPLGGLLFAAAAAAPFLVDAGSFAAAAALVVTVRGQFRTKRPPEGGRRTLAGEVREGVLWLWRRRPLRNLAGVVGLLNLAAAAPLAILVLFARETLELGPAGYGLLLSCGAVGGFAGGLVVDRLVGWIGAGRALFGGILLSAAALAAIAASRNPILVGAMLALAGLCVVVWNVITVTLRQAAVPSRIFGRVNSVYRLLAQGGIAVGALLGGLLADAFTLTTTFWSAAGMLSILAFAALPVMSNPTITAARKGERL